MATQVTMPVLGLTMEEGTVAEWLKREGETVARDEPLLMVEMDKGTVEVPSPAAGVLRRIVVQPGTTVPVRTVIAEIGGVDEALGPAPTPAGGSSAADSGSTAGGPGDLPPIEATADDLAAAATASAATAGAARVPGSASAAATPSAMPSGGPGDLPAPPGNAAMTGSTVSAAASASTRQFASPRARMRARSLGLELAQIRGSGPHGRVVEADVLAAQTQPSPAPRLTATPLARRLAVEHGVDIDAVQGSGPGGRITQDDVLRTATVRPAAAGQRRSLSRVRRITAERMAASAHATARVTLFLDGDFSEAARFRQQLQPEFARLGVARLPWDALIARAAALALTEHPAVLAQWVEGEGLQTPEATHVGVAVTLEPEGLVVPVLRNAATRSLRELAADLLSLVDRARGGRLGPAEMQGGGFTITNLGAYRVDGFTPIINPPETAILGVGRIADRAVVIDGRVEPRTMCTLSLSFDHRVVDGAPAAAFLARLAELLERPYALLGI